jgi:hypothetical protein
MPIADTTVALCRGLVALLSVGPDDVVNAHALRLHLQVSVHTMLVSVLPWVYEQGASTTILWLLES